MTAAPAPAPDPLLLELNVPAELRAGATVPIVLRLMNRGASPIDVALQGRTIAFDVIVARDDGTVVWQRMRNEVVQGILQLRTLAPGEVLEMRAEWDQRGNDGQLIGPGSYRAQGILPSDAPAPWGTPPVAFRITPC